MLVWSLFPLRVGRSIFEVYELCFIQVWEDHSNILSSNQNDRSVIGLLNSFIFTDRPTFDHLCPLLNGLNASPAAAPPDNVSHEETIPLRRFTESDHLSQLTFGYPAAKAVKCLCRFERKHFPSISHGSRSNMGQNYPPPISMGISGS